MDYSSEAQIMQAEEQLKTAMLQSDAAALDELLAPNLIFTNHLGQIVSKEDDLAAHRSGLLQIYDMNSSEQHLLLHGDTAIVSVRVQLSGTYDGNPANGDFRFTRVWTLSPHHTWYVIAAHAGIII